MTTIELSEYVIDAIADAVVKKMQQPCDDAVSRILKRMWNCKGKHTTVIDKVKMEQIVREELPSVTPSRYVNCEIAEHDGNGCLGYSHYGDDFPVKECLHCPKYTSYEEE